MDPKIVLKRLTSQEVLAAINTNDEDYTNEDYAVDDEEFVDDASDSEVDHVSEFELESSDDGGHEKEIQTAPVASTSTNTETVATTINTSVVVTPEATTVSYAGKDGTMWQSTPVQVVRETTRTTRTKMKVYLAPGQHLDTDADCFAMIIDRRVIDILVQYTNIEAKKKKPHFHVIDHIEMKAFIGLLIAAGVDRSSKRNYVEFWGTLRGLAIFKATMGLKRFREIMRFIRFDDKDTRSVRRAKDKFAPIRDVFDIIVANLKRSYSPGDNITIDEQLVPFRGRCAFKQYLPSKPDKYGLKIFWACDSQNWYPLNAIPYLGRERSSSSKNVGIATQTVMDLCKPYYNTNRTVTFDNFFTSYKLAEQLRSNKLTCIGTIRKNKTFIPPEFADTKRRQIGSNLFGFRPRTTLLSYIPKRNKNVLFLSTLHRKPLVSSDGKSEINLYYNRTKAGVDVLDQLCHTYSVQRKTNRWPFAMFMNLINVAGIAAFVISRVNNNKTGEPVGKERKHFLTRLSSELCHEHIRRRSSLGLHGTQKHAIQDILGNDDEDTGPSNEPPRKKARLRCHICPRADDRKSRKICDICNKNVCNKHSTSTLRCDKCAKKPITNSSDSE